MFRSWTLDQNIVTPKLHLKTSEDLTKLAPSPSLGASGASLSSRLQANIPLTFLLIIQTLGYGFSLLSLVPPKWKHCHPGSAPELLPLGVAHGKGSMIPGSHSGAALGVRTSAGSPQLEPCTRTRAPIRHPSLVTAKGDTCNQPLNLTWALPSMRNIWSQGSS